MGGVDEVCRIEAAAVQAELDQARYYLDNTLMVAPEDGRVINLQVRPGMVAGDIRAGAIASFVVDADRYLLANYFQENLKYVKPGQPVEVSVDTYPGRSWHGTVESVSPASQAQFSLLPAQNTSGNWVKVVQRIPLRVRVEPKPGEPELRAGMSAEIEVDTGHQRQWRDLLGGWLG